MSGAGSFLGLCTKLVLNWIVVICYRSASCVCLEKLLRHSPPPTIPNKKRNRPLQTLGYTRWSAADVCTDITQQSSVPPESRPRPTTTSRGYRHRNPDYCTNESNKNILVCYNGIFKRLPLPPCSESLTSVFSSSL